MGIRYAAVHLMSQTLPHLGELSGKTMLTLGVQDCYFTYDQIRAFLKRHAIPQRALPDSAVQTSTAFKGMTPENAARYYPGFEQFIHQKTLFGLLGFEPDNVHALDASPYEQAEIVHDLNEPIDCSLYNSYDFIFDGGTSEHIFSMKDCLFNIARLCRVGGVIVHITPVDMINHGFVNINADLYRDFYSANGFEQIALKYILAPNHPRRASHHYLEYRPEERWFSLQPYYHMVVYAAFRKVDDRPAEVPQQGCYRALWEHGLPNGTSNGTGWKQKLTNRAAVWVDSTFSVSHLARHYWARRRGKKVLL